MFVDEVCNQGCVIFSIAIAHFLESGDNDGIDLVWVCGNGTCGLALWAWGGAHGLKKWWRIPPS